MGLEGIWPWPVCSLEPPTEDEIFERWVAFDDGCTLDEFREAYLSAVCAR